MTHFDTTLGDHHKKGGRVVSLLSKLPIGKGDVDGAGLIPATNGFRLPYLHAKARCSGMRISCIRCLNGDVLVWRLA